MKQFLLNINEKGELRIEELEYQPTEQDIATELRLKKSRDNRDLLDRAAATIEKLENNVLKLRIDKQSLLCRMKHGEWLYRKRRAFFGFMQGSYYCTSCGLKVKKPTSYCPHCGAEMRAPKCD